jgi:hypothetical protein
MIYADYTYYSGPFGGSAISGAYFPALARRASAFIDRMTYGSLQTGVPVTDAVRMATCAVAEAIQQYEASAEQVVSAASLKSESAGGWSETYQDAGDAQTAIDCALRAAGEPYLLYTGLMDRGLSP